MAESDCFDGGSIAVLRTVAIALVTLSILSGARSNATAEESSGGARVAFHSDVMPILKRNCLKCHGVSKSEGQLQLHSLVRVWKGGENGRAVVASAPAESLLWTRVEHDDMPPQKPLTEQEKQILFRWIAQGAEELPQTEAAAQQMTQDEHWAFTRLSASPPPHPKESKNCRTPLDQFIELELEKVGLRLGPETDRRTLIRRIAFTLTGLPPSPDDIDRFLADDGPDAMDAVIEYYLASTQYGIRWGGHWLDAAGYADSNGYFNADSDRPLAYRYRDYVVRSINADKPFDEFVREQIAGDELAGFRPEQHRRAASAEMIDRLIATHYLRNGQDGSGESDGNPDEVRIDRYTALESSQQIIASSLLGLTLQCAKCHDHKFEPLTQLDFYQLQSVLLPAFNPEHWVKPNDRFTFASEAGEYETWEAALGDAKARSETQRSECAAWIQQNRLPELVRFANDFSSATQLQENWTNAIAGDGGPAGVTPVNLVSDANAVAVTAPAARVSDGRLQIIEGGLAGDKWLLTKQQFDWTPESEGEWIQVTFDLVDTKVGDDETPAERIAYGIAVHDFENRSDTPGGNILIDGNPAGGAAVHVDYPGPTSNSAGSIGKESYVAGRSFGVRITRGLEGKFRVEHIVDALPEGPAIDMSEADLPDGSFAFGLCCNRSYQIDNVIIEASCSGKPEIADDGPAQSYLHELHRRQLELKSSMDEVAKLLTTEPGRIAWVTDSTPTPPDVFLLDRGEYSQPKEKVQPVPITILDDEHNSMDITAPLDGVASSGRRLAWANWVTNADSRASSLMARVQVNRIWQHHFGTGIVSTSENLGMSGAEPANPVLLDWLAQEFVRSGWSLKAMHRLILRSRAFAQTSLPNEEGLRLDPYNKLLWRYPMRRLDAESIRDSQLAISGELDLTLDGPYVATQRNGTAEVIVAEDLPGAFRRSIYLQHRRSQGLSMLNVFDAPMMVINCTRRPVTTMPLQSLSLLNSDFAVHRGQRFAERIVREGGDSDEGRIRRAFRLATGRECTEEELIETLQFIDAQHAYYVEETDDPESRAWSDFCQLLLASNACIYLE